MSNNKESFLQRAKKVHGDRYDYSKVDYKADREYVTIICKIHGSFRQRAHNHLRGQNCIKCYLESRRKNNARSSYTVTTYNKYVETLKKRHPNIEIPLESMNKDPRIPIKLHCKLHGDFYKSLYSAQQSVDNNGGCRKCNRNLEPRDKYIEQARLKHGDKFDYSKLDMNDKKPIIICKKHGEFRQEKRNHLVYDLCCPKCISNNIALTKEEFLQRAKEKFGDFYKYDKVEFNRATDRVIIICPIHGEFEVEVAEHIRPKRKGGGCQKCSRSLLETYVEKILFNNGIEYIPQFQIEDFRFRWDFCIPSAKLLIEVDGKSHSSIDTQKKDEIKDMIAKIYDYVVIHIPVITVEQLINFIQIIKTQLSKHIRYKDGKLVFKTFKEFANYKKLPPEAKMRDYDSYLFNPI